MTWTKTTFALMASALVGAAFAAPLPARAQEAPIDDGAPADAEAAPGEDLPSSPEESHAETPSPEDPVAPEEASGPAEPTFPRIGHRPLMQATSTGAQLRFLMQPLVSGVEVVVRVRPFGSDESPHEVVAAFVGGWLRASLPEELLDSGGVEYWVVARDASGEERPVFASEDEPQPVAVDEPTLARWRRQATEAREGRTNTFRLGGEVVQLGPGDGYYLQGTGSYAHHLLTVLETIEIGVGVTRAISEQFDDPGVDFGRATLTFRLHPGVRVRGSSLVGFTDEGFAIGGGATVVFGDPFGTHVEAGGEAIREMGYSARVRVGFDIVHELPMGATVEVTTFPIDTRPSVRLSLDLAYRFAPDTYVKLALGYRGQEAATGGLALGLETAYSFGR